VNVDAYIYKSLYIYELCVDELQISLPSLHETMITWMMDQIIGILRKALHRQYILSSGGFHDRLWRLEEQLLKDHPTVKCRY
jgi:hypothetical protein